jgi:hypothetical protein
MTASRIANWRAIEALRAGVPNRDAVQALGLGSVQPDIEARFRQMLGEVQKGLSPETDPGMSPDMSPAVTADGMLVAGDFGAGKSHLLEYLQHVSASASASAWEWAPGS